MSAEGTLAPSPPVSPRPLASSARTAAPATGWRRFMATTSDSDLAAVSAIGSILPSLTVPYWVIGGWAIDLAAGSMTRDYTNMDVMRLERDKHALWSDLAGVDVEPAGSLGPRRLVLHSDRLPAAYGSLPVQGSRDVRGLSPRRT